MDTIINIIIVDDSAFMRKTLTMMLESDPQIKVIATARDGNDGVEKIRKLKPDLVTMDIEMPGLDGLGALKIIMKEMPLPVLMCSSLTTEGAQATMDALNLGAVDFIPKDFSALPLEQIRQELVSKVRHIALNRSLRARLSRIRTSTRLPLAPEAKPPRSYSVPSRVSESLTQDFKAVVLGISTGGPFALLQTLPKLPADFPLGMVIVQHMPPKFTKSMAERLDGLCSLSVKEADDGDLVEPGHVLVAPGGRQLSFQRSGSGVRVHVSDDPPKQLYKPSADVMMTSAVEVFRGPLLGVIMTGMGRDGLEGLRLIKKTGGYVIAQDEESCVVFGMPKSAIDDGVADVVLSLEDIPLGIVKAARGKNG